MRTLTQNLRDDLTGVAWTEEDFEQSLERARNLWREVWPEAGIKFLRGKSTQAAPPPGLPPPRAIGPIATAPIGSIASISSSSASGSKPPAAKPMPPSKPTRPAPKPKEREAMKEEGPHEEAVKTEDADVKKEEEVTAPPGFGLVDELQAMTPAQKKARIQLFQLTKPCRGHIG